MAFKKFRNVKVYEQNGYNYKSMPTITLKGQWLKEAGFNVGDPSQLLAGMESRLSHRERKSVL